jgi:predicted AAA+ superfamily ATPase
MFERLLVSRLRSRLKEPRRFIQIVTGPRQTGKTTAVTQATANPEGPVLFVSADDPGAVSSEWIRLHWLQARILAQPNTASVLVIDEIQKIDQWSSMVKLLWDEDSRLGHNVKVVLLGSSSLLIHHGLNESLMGRFEVLHCPHWNYSECHEAFGYSLEDFIYYGGYPAAAALIHDEVRWASYLGAAIVEPTISQDILALEPVRKPALLRSLFMLGATYSGQELSYTKMLGQLTGAGNTTTLAHYLDLLGQANILTGLPKLSSSPLKTRRGSPRFMVFDTSLMTYAAGPSRTRFRDNPTDRGHLVESAVGAYLLARSQTDDFDVLYWRDRNDEVDFVIRQGETIVGIEVKSGTVKKPQGAVAFMKTFPQATGMIVGSATCPLEEFLVGNIPLFMSESN